MRLAGLSVVTMIDEAGSRCRALMDQTSRTIERRSRYDTTLDQLSLYPHAMGRWQEKAAPLTVEPGFDGVNCGGRMIRAACLVSHPAPIREGAWSLRG